MAFSLSHITCHASTTVMANQDPSNSEPDPPVVEEPTTPKPGENRFIFKGAGEPLNDYRPGGYHPVHLKDFFKDARYKVIRKLGHGLHAAVWLANDLM